MAYKITFFLYTDVKEMNSPGEVILRGQGVLMPLRWVYVCARVCKYIWIFPLCLLEVQLWYNLEIFLFHYS